MQGVFVRELGAPPLNLSEILRYAGMRGTPDDGLSALLDSCLAEVAHGLCYRVCFLEHGVKMTDTGVDFGYMQVDSADLARCLSGCDRALTFVATVGPLPDRMIARYGRVAPTKALLHQAIGAERIEALCDAFLDLLRAEQGISLCPRFSPGYGDLSLTVQGDIFRALNPARLIGVSTTDSLLMVPSKSVTAIVGIKKEQV
ncbi:MAG: Vitamin B12 dependent methionine synthase activation subunit [Clostridia bacterium]|nr:Vitamin B12 dependent methionine synthase activation subunit [Clostridia bacterium]